MHDNSSSLAEKIENNNQRWARKLVQISVRTPSNLFILAGLIAERVLSSFSLSLWLFGVLCTVVIGSNIAYEIYGNSIYRQREKLLDENREIRSDNSELVGAYEALGHSLALAISQEINAWDKDTRITFYGHHDSYLIPLIRRSYNPEHARGGRDSYPLDCGYIGVIWRTGSSIKSKLSNHAWNRSLENCLSPEAIAKLRFNAKSLVGVRIDDGSGRPIGIILIECLLSDPFDKDIIKTIEQSVEFKQIKNWIINHPKTKSAQ